MIRRVTFDLDRTRIVAQANFVAERASGVLRDLALIRTNNASFDSDETLVAARVNLRNNVISKQVAIRRPFVHSVIYIHT